MDYHYPLQHLIHWKSLFSPHLIHGELGLHLIEWVEPRGVNTAIINYLSIVNYYNRQLLNRLIANRYNCLTVIGLVIIIIFIHNRYNR